MPKPKQSSPLELYHQRKLREERERAAFLPPGLINHGNTCFMNSVLQGILATRLLHDLATFAPISTELQRYLPTSLSPARSPQLTNGHGVAGEHEQPSIDCMPIGDRFLTIMHRGWDAQSEKRRESISPKPILNALGRKYPQYLDFAQQDAHEFMRILFDAMRMEEIDVIKTRQSKPVNRKPRKRKHVSGAKRKRSSTPACPSADTLVPFTDMVFGGQLTSILICQKCKHISQTYEDFYDISLSIKPEDYASPSTSPPPSVSSTALFSLGRSLSGVKEKAKGEAREKEKGKEGGNEEHGRERKRDKLKKFMKGITPSALTQANPVEPDAPRASSVPPDDSEEKKLDDVRSRKDASRKRRSRSLDHLYKVTTLQTVRDTSEEREGVEDERGSGDGGSGRDEMNARAPSTSDTVESDWSVIKEDMEVNEEILPASDEKKRKKDKEDDGWVKLGKRLSMLTRQPKDKEPTHRERILEEIRARRKSRESSPDRCGTSGRSTTRRDLTGPPPPLPTKTQPASTPPNLSPPAIHHQPSSSPKLSFLSPLSQPAYHASPLKVVHSVLQSTTTLSGTLSLYDLNRDKDKLSGLPGVQLPANYENTLHVHSPTSAEAEYLKRILADIDVSRSESSPTPSGGWPSAAPAPPSNGLVNPFALLMKSSASKKGSDGTESGSKADLAVAVGGSAGEARPSRKWSSWLGMNRLSGMEECLRLFTSVEVLDNENMVGCRRCWKIANREKEREASRQHGDEHEDGTDDDDESSSEEEDEENFPKSPASLLSPTQALTMAPEDYEASDTPGGMPIPTISTTGPESPLEPPSRPRMQHAVRSNSADFVSLSAISSGEEAPMLASTLLRNASSPSIPSRFVSPHASPHSRSSFPPYTLSNHLYSHPPPQVNMRDSLVIPRAPLVRRRATGVDSTDGESDESTSGADSRSGGEDGDDRLSIGSLSSTSPPRSGESRSLSDKAEEESPVPDITVSEAHTNGEAKETEKSESKEEAKIPKKPKPVIMRPAYKRYLIATPPPVLVIHLKRFQQTDKTPLISFTPTYGFKKLDDYVTFPEYLDLTPFLAPKREDFELDQAVDGEEGVINGGGSHGVKRELGEEHGKCMYRLYAVVVHIGNMLGGHYVAYTAIPDQPATPGSSGASASSAADEGGAKLKPKPPSANSVSSSTLVAPSISSSKSSNGSRPERQWAYISDANVRLATLEEVLKAKAYICMYERISS